MEKNIDLHIHTNYSDGAFSPKEIIDFAVANNTKVISITDHDTIDAYSDELFEYAKTKGVKLITGVEISTKEKTGFHILGYNINLEDTKFREILSKVRNSRHDYLLEVSKKLTDIGYLVNTSDLDKIESVTKAHIALDIINNDLNSDLLITNFGHIPTKGEFIETIMNEGCIAFVNKVSMTPKEAVSIIKEAGGKAFLAHPVAYKYEDNLNEEQIINLALNINVDGIESNYIYIDRNSNKINEIDIWNNLARENNLITSIGSDFHNDNNINPKIGLINENIIISDESIQKLIDYLQ